MRYNSQLPCEKYLKQIFAISFSEMAFTEEKKASTDSAAKKKYEIPIPEILTKSTTEEEFEETMKRALQKLVEEQFQKQQKSISLPLVQMSLLSVSASPVVSLLGVEVEYSSDKKLLKIEIASENDALLQIYHAAVNEMENFIGSIKYMNTSAVLDY